MHAEVVSTEAGECPICHMALEPRGGRPHAEHQQESGAATPSTVAASPRTVAAATSASPLGATWLPETFPPASNAKPNDGLRLALPERRTFTESVRAPAWIEATGRIAALLYRDELVGLGNAARGTFFRALTPKEPIPVRLADEPPTPWDASTVLVRFVIVAEPRKNDAHERTESVVHGADVGMLELPPVTRELLVVPESALLRSSEGPYVLVPEGSGKTPARRSIRIGRFLKGRVVVLAGLGDREAIVVGNAFLLDARHERAPRAETLAEIAP